MKPLDGIKVLDLTHVLAGPYCTYQLSMLGADVIKVESPLGDMVRIWGGSDQQVAMKLGSGFVPQNAGKRSLCIDLNKPEAQDIVMQLAAEADVMVENYERGTMDRFGLDYASVSKLNPGIIYLSISAFGRNGPHGHRPGFDDVIQATSGFMSINQRGDGPIRTGGPVLDYATGMHAVSAILGALLLKTKSGKGQYLDVAMQDVALLLINRNTSIAATTGEPPAPANNREGPLLGRYATADGYAMLAGYLPAHCRAICHAIGLTEYGAISSREFNERVEEIEAAVEQRLLTRTSGEWDAVFSEARAVGGGVRDLMEVLATGQPEARGLLEEVASAAGTQMVTTAGYLADDGTYGPSGRVPMLGEDSRAVLMGLGIEAEAYEALLEAGVVYEAANQDR